MLSSTPTRGLPLTFRLLAVLVAGSVMVALIVAQVAADRSVSERTAAHHQSHTDLANKFAGRVASLLEAPDDEAPDDLERLRLVAAATAHLGGCRALIVDAAGTVVVDTGGGRRVGEVSSLAAIDGTRRIELAEAGVWEVSAPAYGNTGLSGEVRLRYQAATPEGAAFPWELAAVALVSCLTLIALAGWICHGWVLELRHLAARVRDAARGDVSAFERGATNRLSRGGGAVGELRDAMIQLASVNSDAADEAGRNLIRLGRQVVHSLEQRELVESGHSDRTRRYAEMLACELDLPEADRREITDVAMLHDLGKACVRPSAITKSPAELDADEVESLRQHPLRGASFLAGVSALEGVVRGLRHQGETYDGGGFPDGLRGDRIPLSSRIAAIAAAFDDSMADGAAWPEALEWLRDQRGERFDPDLLDVFEELVRRQPPSLGVRDRVIISSSGQVGRPADDETTDFAWSVDEQDEILAFGDSELELFDGESDSGPSIE